MNKKRKIIIGIVVGVAVAVLLGLVLIKPFTAGMKPEKKETTEPAKPPVTYSYGEDAYQYLVRIDGEFGNRVNGKTTVSLTQKERMGAFISETMRSFGYPEQIYAESHPANGTTRPMKSYTYRKAFLTCILKEMHGSIRREKHSTRTDKTPINIIPIILPFRIRQGR